MQLTFNDYRIRLIDSLNFLQMPSSKFPETFGLDLSTHSKGDFPFKFNTVENQNYIGPVPDIKFYDADNKKDETKRIDSRQQILLGDLNTFLRSNRLEKA